MADADEGRFRPRVGPPKARGGGPRADRFVTRVLRAASKAGPTGRVGVAPRRAATGARLGRGHVAAQIAGSRLTGRSRRVVVKARLVVLAQAGARSTATHLRYIQRDAVGREGEPGRAYGPAADAADADAFEERGREDRHQFRFIVAPEDGEQIGDLSSYTRGLMARMEADLGTKLDWIAVDHHDTGNPHTHVVLRGRDETRRDLVIARDYISHGMRARAAELATEWLGQRTEREIRAGLEREVDQARWTGLDRTILREAAEHGGAIELGREPGDAHAQFRRGLIAGRLRRLGEMGLAAERSPGAWTVAPEAERILRAMGEREDIVRIMQRALGAERREMAVFEPARDGAAIVGRIAAKGLADELQDRGYLVVDGVDGRAHYVVLPTGAELADYPVGGVVEVRGATGPRAADRTITAVSEQGIYRTERHLALVRTDARPGQEPEEFVQAHVRRLEALRRAGVVERLAEGVWRVPIDLPERGRDHDAGRTGAATAELRSHLSIGDQRRAIGATWLDRKLLDGGLGLATTGFGAAAREVMREREAFLASEGLARRHGQRLILARDLLATLRAREVGAAAKAIADETGLTHRPIADGERASGVYRRSVQLASGRFAMLDDGAGGFSLVPWRPVLERRLGAAVSGVVRGDGVSWDIGTGRSLGR